MQRNPNPGLFKRAELIAGHCVRWARSSSNDVFIANPNFNVDTIPADKTSIYCVHGTADRNESFSLIAGRLKGILPPNVDGFYLLSFDGEINGVGIEVFAKQLKDKILTKARRGNRAILMGHSRGGLIASWFAENLAAANGIHVDLVACICAPFRGSYLAKWPLAAILKSVDEMRTDSDFVKSLSEKIENSNINYQYFGSDKDMIVDGFAWIPYHLDQRDRRCFMLAGHSHVSIMSSDELVEKLAATMQNLYVKAGVSLPPAMI